MNSLNDFHFLRPAWLLLVPPIAGLWWLSRRRLDPLAGWRSMMESQLLAAMTVGEDSHSRRRIDFLLLTWLIATVSIAGPAWWPEPSPFSDDPVPVMLVLKAGESMQLADLSPSRMERARLKVADFAAARGSEPLGLIAYAASAHLVLPPTRDTSVVASMAAEISPEIMPQQGDDLSAALKLAVMTLGKRRGSIVIILDAVTNADNTALESFAKDNRVPIHMLAVARPDTPELDNIRSAANVVSADVTLITPDSQDVNNIVQAAAGSPRSVSAADEGVRWAEAGWWLVPLLVGLSLIGFRRETAPSAMEASS